MKLLKRLKNNSGLFLCEKCNNEVQRRIDNGSRQVVCSYNCRKKKHGDSYIRLYRIYIDMKSRCFNLNNKHYKDYGGRSITICSNWLGEIGYINFRDWALSNAYKNNLIIDRINNDEGYYPENCRWVTQAKNAQNRRSTKLAKEKVLEIREKYKTGNYLQKELAMEYKLNQSHISAIINDYYWRNI